MKKSKLSIAIIILAVVILAVTIFAVDGPENILLAISSVQIGWVLAAIGCMVAYWALEAFVLHGFILPMAPRQKFSNTLQVSMAGQYFNSITPFASGGQPFQAFYLTKQGIPVSAGATALLSKFIVYQVALTLLSLAVLVWKLRFFTTTISNFAYLAILGFAVNSFVVLMLLAAAFFRRPTRMAVRWVLWLGHKLHLVADPEGKMAQVDRSLGRFYDNCRFLIGNIPLLIRSLLLSMVQILCYLTVAYMVYRAFGLYGADFFEMIAASAFVLLISSFIPLPGAAVASEGSFYLFFSIFFPDSILKLAVLFWRLITFYLTIVVGAAFAMMERRNVTPAELAERVRETTSEKAREAAERVRETGERVKETAERVKETTSERAEQMAEHVKETAERVKENTEEKLHAQPKHGTAGHPSHKHGLR